MCCHSKCREWHAPGHQARATVGQTALLKAERARQNRAYVRKLLQERQPEFAAALAAANEQIVRQRGAPDVTACHTAEKHSSTGTQAECSKPPLRRGLRRPWMLSSVPEILMMQPQPTSRMPGQDVAVVMLNLGHIRKTYSEGERSWISLARPRW